MQNKLHFMVSFLFKLTFKRFHFYQVSTTSKTYENEEKEFKVNPYYSLKKNYISVRPYKKNRKATKVILEVYKLFTICL